MKLQNKNLHCKKNTANIILKTIIFTVLIIYAASILYTLLWGILNSLKSSVDFSVKNNIFGFPNPEYSSDEMFKLKNYQLILDRFYIERSIGYWRNGVLIEHTTRSTLFTMVGNAIYFALVQALVPTLFSAIMAYLCSRFKEFKSIVIWYYVALVAMMVPALGSYPAEISILQNLGVYDTYVGVLLQKSYYGGTYFFVFHAFFQGVSGTYAEAAEIDGASQYRIFFQIILPLVGTAFATIALIQFVAGWNDFRLPLMYMPTHPSVAYGVYNLTLETAPAGIARLTTRLAACMLLAIPILIIFLIFKDKLMGNVSLGGLKE